MEKETIGIDVRLQEKRMAFIEARRDAVLEAITRIESVQLHEGFRAPRLLNKLKARLGELNHTLSGSTDNPDEIASMLEAEK